MAVCRLFSEPLTDWITMVLPFWLRDSGGRPPRTTVSFSLAISRDVSLFLATERVTDGYVLRLPTTPFCIVLGAGEYFKSLLVSWEVFCYLDGRQKDFLRK